MMAPSGVTSQEDAPALVSAALVADEKLRNLETCGTAETIRPSNEKAKSYVAPVAAELPRVAASNVVPFATRGKSSTIQKSLNAKTKRATRGKSGNLLDHKSANSGPVVEPGKGSKNTWQFRLRWNSLPGRPVVYVATVTDAVYERIRQGDYEAYKRQIIASYQATSVSAGHKA